MKRFSSSLTLFYLLIDNSSHKHQHIEPLPLPPAQNTNAERRRALYKLTAEERKQRRVANEKYADRAHARRAEVAMKYVKILTKPITKKRKANKQIMRIHISHALYTDMLTAIMHARSRFKSIRGNNKKATTHITSVQYVLCMDMCSCVLTLCFSGGGQHSRCRSRCRC